MEEQIRDPKEELSYIRSILERTVDDMRGVAPFFARLGIVWLVYGILSAALRLGVALASSALQMPLSYVNAAAGWAFFIFLAADYILARRRQKGDLGAPALKLLDMWGACIVVFLGLCVILSALPVLAVRGAVFSAASVNDLGCFCAVSRSCLIFLLPVLPLLLTALFLENRRMLRAGIALSVLAAALLGAHILLLAGSGAEAGLGWIWGFFAAACLLDIAPGVMLLMLAASLERS